MKKTWIILTSIHGDDEWGSTYINLVKTAKEIDAVWYLSKMMLQVKENDVDAFKGMISISNSTVDEQREYSSAVFFEDYEISFEMKPLSSVRTTELG